MKKITFILILFFAFNSIAKSQKTGELSSPDNAMSVEAKMKWLGKTAHDFGKIKKGIPVTIVFEFENEGKAPIIITGVQVSCGCTVADYSKQPIPPKKKGYVKATFDAAKIGTFDKTITVSSNATGNQTLFLKGEVI